MSRLPEQRGIPTRYSKGTASTMYYSTQAPCTRPPVEPDQEEPRRTPTSARYRPTGVGPTMSAALVRVTHHRRSIPLRARAAERHTQEQLAPTELGTPIAEPIRRAPRHRVHCLTYVGATLFVMIAGFFIINAGVNWWKSWQDDMRYGRPRTYQADARVGHSDSITPSHFIAVNLSGRILVTEIAGGDPARSKIYIGPDIGDADIPVTLEFRDVNGDKRLDMLIMVNKKAYPFINDTIDNKPQFRPVKEDEMVHL